MLWYSRAMQNSIDPANVVSKSGGELSGARERRAAGLLEGWVSIAVNLVVGVVKLVAGLAIGSISLVADAVHSFSDLVTSGAVIWGFSAAARPSDRRHPFGHGRLESVAALLIAVLLLVAALEFAMASVRRLLAPQAVTASWTLVAVLVATVIAKEWLARFALRLGRRIDSTALRADAWHHRSDVFATAVVIVALVGARFGISWLDGAAGLVVAGALGWTGVTLVKESADPLIGAAPSPGLVEEIKGVALAVPGVDAVHDVIVHRYGELLVTSLHIEVNAERDAMACHELAEQVEEAVMGRFGGWAVVHVDPVDRAHPLYSDIAMFLSQRLGSESEAASFHDLRIFGRQAPCYVIFDLKAAPEESERLQEQLVHELKERFPQVAKVLVNLEPRYVY